jgi:hypothetical protein
MFQMFEGVIADSEESYMLWHTTTSKGEVIVNNLQVP